jgi:nucleoside diphosphate kinase
MGSSGSTGCSCSPCATEMTEDGLLLLKPDGAASNAVRAALEEALTRHGLKIVARRVLQLTRADVVALWPMFAGGSHPVMSALYKCYMTSGPSEALLFSGEDAPARCSAIKSEIRRAFEVCAIENAIHAPADDQERLANRAWLFDGTTAVPDLSWPDWSKQGRYGAALSVPDTEIDRIANAIWTDRVSQGWIGVFHDLPSDANAAWRAELRPGDPNSIDFGVSLLFETLPRPDFETCVRRYLQAEVTGRAVIAAGKRDDVEAIRTLLARHRMTVEITER